MSGTKYPNGEPIFSAKGEHLPPSVPVRKMLDSSDKDAGLRRLAESLSRAHIKYFHLFGVEPHGTIQQLMAMLELCPEAKEYVRLYEKQREQFLST